MFFFCSVYWTTEQNITKLNFFSFKRNFACSIFVCLITGGRFSFIHSLWLSDIFVLLIKDRSIDSYWYSKKYRSLKKWIFSCRRIRFFSFHDTNIHCACRSSIHLLIYFMISMEFTILRIEKIIEMTLPLKDYDYDVFHFILFLLFHSILEITFEQKSKDFLNEKMLF